MNKHHHLVLVFILILTGLALFLYKAFVLHFPLKPDTTSNVWNVEAKISFTTVGRPAKLSVFIPRGTSRISIVEENFISQGFGLNTLVDEGNRFAEWSIRRSSGAQSIFYSSRVRVTENPHSVTGSKLPELETSEFAEAELAAAKSILSESHQESADTISKTRSVLNKLTLERPDDNVALLLGKRPTELKRLQVLAKILALDKIAVRIVHGIVLEESIKTTTFMQWLEVHDGKEWISLSPDGSALPADANLLPWWRGSDPVGYLYGGNKLKVDVSIRRNQEDAIVSALDQTQASKPLLFETSLFNLPIETQNVFRIVLLIPIGGLLIVLLRNVVGLPTFGTFMPVLVALAFRETEIITGVIFFSLVVAIGLSVRFYLERLKLLLVPRLASVLTVVVIILTFLALFAHKFHIEHGLSIALFPMVILTMTIERMSIVWDELGPGDAIKQGLGSLFSAICATLLMGLPLLEHLFFVFPELLLIVLACALALGRYTGYRLTELYRFKELSREEH